MLGLISQRPLKLDEEADIRRDIRAESISGHPSLEGPPQLDSSVGCSDSDVGIVKHPSFKHEICRRRTIPWQTGAAQLLEDFALADPLPVAFLAGRPGLDCGTNASTSERRTRVLPATTTGFSFPRRIRLAMACLETPR